MYLSQFIEMLYECRFFNPWMNEEMNKLLNINKNMFVTQFVSHAF